MTDNPSEMYPDLLRRAGASSLSAEDIADLTPGLLAIDGKIALLRAVAAKTQGALPDPLFRKDADQ